MMNNNPRLIQGAPNNMDQPRVPAAYGYRMTRAPVFSHMLANPVPHPHPVSTNMVFMPYNPGIVSHPAMRPPFPSPAGNICVPLRMSPPSTTPVDLRSQSSKQPAVRTSHNEDSSSQKASAAAATASQDQPLDLSTKVKPQSSPLDNQSVVNTNSDMPLDLSKPSKSTQSSATCRPSSTSLYSYAATSGFTAKKPATTPSQTGAVGHLVKPLHSAASSTSSSYSSSEADDRVNCMTPSNMSSVSSLIGSHPIDDILYLHCKRCQSSYGSVHAFRKHFRNVHGYMPSSDDVLIQGIKATKEYVANKNETTVPAVGMTKFHCNYCGWQCDHNNHTAFTHHLSEHYEEKGTVYRCFYCKDVYSDANTLRSHLSYHTRVYQYICAFCHIAFQIEEHLATHMNSHHGASFALRRPQTAVAHVSPSYITSTDISASSCLPLTKSAPNNLMSKPISYSSRDHLNSKTAQTLPSTPPSHNHDVLRPNFIKLPDVPTSQMGISSCTPIKPKTDGMTIAAAAVAARTAITSATSITPCTVVASSCQTPTNSSGKNLFNLMSLLDKVVEQGLRSAEPVSADTIVSKRSVPSEVRPTYSVARSSSSSVDLTTKTSSPVLNSAPILNDDASIPAGAHKMSGKTIIEHITEAVTRELIGNQEPVSSRSSVQTFLERARDVTSNVNSNYASQVNGLHAKESIESKKLRNNEDSSASSLGSMNACKIEIQSDSEDESDMDNTNLMIPATVNHLEDKVVVASRSNSSKTEKADSKDANNSVKREADDRIDMKTNRLELADSNVNGSEDKVTSSDLMDEDTKNNIKHVSTTQSQLDSYDTDDSNSPKRLKVDEGD